MRLKLKRNYHFDSHADAVKENSMGDLDLQEEANQTQEETLRLFSGMKLAAVGFDPSLSEDSQTLVLPTEPENENLESIVPQEERLIYSSPCELITPLTVTPGILEITTYKIFFKESEKKEEKNSNSN